VENLALFLLLPGIERTMKIRFEGFGYDLKRYHEVKHQYYDSNE